MRAHSPRAMKTLFAFFALAACACGHVMEATISGTLFNDRGSFFASLPPQTPFVLTVQFDTDAVDWNPDPHIGEYFADLPLSLDFGDYHFATTGTRVTVIADPADLNSQILFWSGDEFDQPLEDGRIFPVPEYGIYVQLLTFGMGLVPDDSLASVQPPDITDWRSSNRLYVVDPAYLAGDGDGNRLLSDEHDGITSITIRDVPEADPIALALVGAILAVASLRSR